MAVLFTATAVMDIWHLSKRSRTPDYRFVLGLFFAVQTHQAVLSQPRVQIPIIIYK